MGEAYATVDEYRALTGDEASDYARVAMLLSQQSAKLRAVARIGGDTELTEDQRELCRFLVTDACRKALVTPTLAGLGDVAGVTQATFSADGFSGSYQVSNGAGVPYFDRDTLRALTSSLGTSSGIASVALGGE